MLLVPGSGTLAYVYAVINGTHYFSENWKQTGLGIQTLFCSSSASFSATLVLEVCT